MEYYTRSLYSLLQSNDDSVVDTASEQWTSQGRAYRSYLQSIAPLLADAVRDFASISWHDSVIVDAKCEELGAFELRLNSSNNPWGHRGDAIITFSGVTKIHPQDISQLIGDEWLYSEMKRLSDTTFQYSALLQRNDLSVTAANVGYTVLK